MSITPLFCPHVVFATFAVRLGAFTGSTSADPETTHEVVLSLTVTEYKPAAKSLISSDVEEYELGPDHTKV
jgi:hypothetical protein